jgi:uncharacterized protein
VLALIVLAAGGAGLSACARDHPPPVNRLVVAAGPPASAYDALGRAFAEAIRQRWGVPVDVRATGGSVDNLTQVARDEADLGFAALDVAHVATQGDEPFPGAMAVAPLAGLYDDYLHVVVPARSAIRTLRDLAGRPVSLGSAASGTPVIAERVLIAAGLALHDLTPTYLDAAGSAEALRAGTVDAFFVTGGLPTGAVADLAAGVPIRLLPVTDDVNRLRDESGGYYRERFITAGTYGLDAEVATVGVANVLVVPRTMPDDLAEALTALLFASRPRLVDAHAEARHLDPRSAIAVTPLTLHPGAVTYYRGAKPLAVSAGTSAAGPGHAEVHEDPAEVVRVLLHPVVQGLDLLLVEEAQHVLLQRARPLARNDLDQAGPLRHRLFHDLAQRPVDVPAAVVDLVEVELELHAFDSPKPVGWPRASSLRARRAIGP